MRRVDALHAHSTRANECTGCLPKSRNGGAGGGTFAVFIAAASSKVGGGALGSCTKLSTCDTSPASSSSSPTLRSPPAPPDVDVAWSFASSCMNAFLPPAGFLLPRPLKHPGRVPAVVDFSAMSLARSCAQQRGLQLNTGGNNKDEGNGFREERGRRGRGGVERFVTSKGWPCGSAHFGAGNP